MKKFTVLYLNIIKCGCEISITYYACVRKLWTFPMKTQSCKSTSLVSFSSPSFTRSNFITPMQSGTLSIVMYLDSWHVGGFFGNHFYIVDPTCQFDRERLRQKSLTPQLGYFPKKRGLFVCFGFLIKSMTDCRFPYLVTLSPQNSVITVCPVTPSTFVHIIVNFCTYQLQLFYISIKTILSYFNHCTMWVYRHWFDLHLHCILNWAHHHTLPIPKFSQLFELCI